MDALIPALLIKMHHYERDRKLETPIIGRRVFVLCP